MKRTLRGSKTASDRQNPPADYEQAARMAQGMNIDLNNMQDTIQDTVNKYGGKSQDELLRELKNYKSAGGMDDKALDGVAQKLMPMLNPEQQRRLFDVMGQLKR